MPTWVCLLRGVNVGKARKLSMGALRGALTAAGLTDVQTYLQSGNVVADSRLRTHEQVSALVRSVVASELTLDDVPVVARRHDEIDQVITSNPFVAQASQRPHMVRVIFLAATPLATRVDTLMSEHSLRDTCRVVGNHVYVDYVDSSQDAGRTAASVTRTLGVDGTERNWRTVLALSELCSRRSSAPSR